MVVRSSAFWDGVRIAYEQSPETLDTLAVRFNVSRRAILYHARGEGWRRRRASSNAESGRPEGLLKRLYRSIDRKLWQLEKRMDKDDDLSSTEYERETRALGQLIQNFERVAGLDGERTDLRQDEPAGGARDDRRSRRERADPVKLRNELAQRILRLREAGPRQR